MCRGALLMGRVMYLHRARLSGSPAGQSKTRRLDGGNNLAESPWQERSKRSLFWPPRCSGLHGLLWVKHCSNISRSHSKNLYVFSSARGYVHVLSPEVCIEVEVPSLRRVLYLLSTTTDYRCHSWTENRLKKIRQ